MSKRKSVLEKDKSRRRHQQQQRREATAFLEKLGLSHLLSGLNSKQREHLLLYPRKPLAIDFRKDVQLSNEEISFIAHSIMKAYEDMMETKITVKTGVGDKEVQITLYEFYSIAYYMYKAAARPRASHNDKQRDCVTRLYNAFDSIFVTGIDEAWEDLVTLLMLASISRSWYDGIIICPSTAKTADDPTYIINITRLKEDRVDIGGTRPVMAVAQAMFGGLRYLSADGAMFGYPGKTFDFYIQQHAIQRLKERMSSLKYLSYFVSCSLAEPTVIKYRDNYLIQLKYSSEDNYKVGYFPIKIVGSKAVITTFLFLTMQGTPEGDKLRDILRMTTSDIEWNRLDDISTFIETDLFDDPTMARALIASGCESLKLLYHKNLVISKITPRFAAADIKQYLGLTSPQKEKQLHLKLDRLKENA